ncbi:MAG TPA: NAD(+) synthase [Bacteroidales bacterium]|nr:NAD(+) synthase [Bacteroidales bacterium]
MTNQAKKPFSKDILIINDIEAECNRLINNIRESVFNRLNRLGGVIGISGGIDSSVCMALAARALGTDKMLAIMLPEHDSSNDSALFAGKLADKFGVKAITENITGALDGFGCYQRRDEAVKSVFPEYDPSEYKMKIGIKTSGLSSSLPPIFSVTIVDKNGNEQSHRVPAPELRQIEAASNLKQRSRMSMLYYHAERLHYAVIGTPNKHEVEQGFFVKNGDGGADVMPISHLFKTQVYQMAHYLGIPEEIINRTPTSDTYSAEQTQEEFFFQMPFEEMDLLWYAFKNNYDKEEVAEVMGKTPDEIQRIFAGFDRKIKTTAYLRMQPITF